MHSKIYLIALVPDLQDDLYGVTSSHPVGLCGSQQGLGHPSVRSTDQRCLTCWHFQRCSVHVCAIRMHVTDWPASLVRQGGRLRPEEVTMSRGPDGEPERVGRGGSGQVGPGCQA